MVALTKITRLSRRIPCNRLMSTNADHENSNLKVTFDEKTGVRTIMINRPTRFNAFNDELYRAFPQALKEAGDDWPRTKVTLLTGNTASPWYSSGNDLTDFLARFKNASNMKQAAEEMGDVLQKFVASFIDFGPGLLVASLHGPATGISCTTLPLCDAAYASDSCRLTTPFTKLAQAPEGCSTFTFPMNMGDKSAMDIIAFDGILTAQEAKLRGLLTDVFPDHNFQNEVKRKIERVAKLPVEAMQAARNSVKLQNKVQLHQANDAECRLLVERWQSKECLGALMAFGERKK